MLSVALRLIAISLGFYGIITCAKISAAVFEEHTLRDSIMLTDMEKMCGNVESPSSSPVSIRPTLRIDTSVAETNSNVILEVFPERRPQRAFSLDVFSSKVLQFMTGVLGSVEGSSGGSRRAKNSKRRAGRPQQRWAHVECSV